MMFLDIPQPVPGLDEVIAGVEIAVVLQGQRVAAGFGKDAQRGGQSQPGGKGRLEQLNKDIADVVRDPLVKDADEKPSPILRFDGAFGHQCAILRVKGTPAIVVSPPGIGDFQKFSWSTAPQWG